MGGFFDRLLRWLLGDLPPPVSPPVPPAKPPPVPPPQPPVGDWREAFLDAHNVARAGRGLPALKWDPRLEAAAKVQAEDNARRDQLSHYGSDGSTPWTRMAKQGVPVGYAGENAAMWGAGWLASPGQWTPAQPLAAMTAWSTPVRPVGDGTPPLGVPVPAEAPAGAATAGIDAAVRMWLSEGPMGGHYQNVMGRTYTHVGGWLAIAGNGNRYCTGDYAKE